MTQTTEADRELLELAAKAAGYESGYVNDEFRVLVPGGCGTWGCNKLHATKWNPLADDGDAFRLSVRLALFWRPEMAHFLALERFGAQDRDDCYAHRRAIVRAAAALATASKDTP